MRKIFRGNTQEAFEEGLMPLIGGEGRGRGGGMSPVARQALRLEWAIAGLPFGHLAEWCAREGVPWVWVPPMGQMVLGPFALQSWLDAGFCHLSAYLNTDCSSIIILLDQNKHAATGLYVKGFSHDYATLKDLEQWRRGNPQVQWGEEAQEWLEREVEKEWARNEP